MSNTPDMGAAKKHAAEVLGWEDYGGEVGYQYVNLARAFLAMSRAASAAPPREPTQFWGVTVSRNGADVVTIETNCLSGKDEFDAEDEEAIRTAGKHLLAFIGDAAPAQPAETPGAMEALREAAEAVNKATFSHVDGRDLLAELHPRSELDIKRRKDGKDYWYEGDWLTALYRAVQQLRAALAQSAAKPIQEDKSND